MSGRSIGTVNSLLLVAALVNGCGAQALPPQDKAGSETLVLKLATPDVVNNNGQSFGPQAFVDSLESVSGGRIKVDMTLNYGDGAVDSETRMIRAIMSGEVDGGWPSVRAFANAGISGLAAVEAPLTITSYAASKALVSGPVAKDLLAKLDGTGVVGLGLAVGPLRRPFASTAPLLGPEDWQGVTFRSFNSPVQADTIRALGATPLQVGAKWPDLVHAGTLRGAEFDVAQYDANGLSNTTPYATSNVVLWPKVFVLAVSQKRYDTMTDQQRLWVRQAAEAATKASVDATYDESTIAQSMCQYGVRFIDASAAQLAALHAAVAPVINKLSADPVSGPLLAEIQAVAAQHPGVDEPKVPADCHDAGSAAPSPSIPEDVSALPNGRYRHRVTMAEVHAAGIPTNAGSWTGTWTLTVKDGTFTLGCRFIDLPNEDCGSSGFDGSTTEAGHLRGIGNTVYFVNDLDMLQKASGCVLPVSTELGHCFLVPPYWLDWTVAGGQLTFSHHGGDPGGQEYELAPWTKID
jgi:TRAP-type C4-dicarboxylate transport system substrate-binding protein